MGQLESKEHKLFVHLLQSMIKSQGHNVKLKIIEEFVHIIREICPWVPEATPSPAALHTYAAPHPMAQEDESEQHPVQQPTAAGASMPVALRSTASAPISPLTHALMSLHRGFSDYDNMFPASFPVIEVVDNQGNPIRNYESIPPKTFKELKEVLKNLTISALPPTDWGHLTKACLSGGDYLLWRANYEDGAYEQQIGQQIPITLDKLLGRGQYEPLAAQATLPTEAFAQINTL
ncbi:Gag polyprotein, partial [Plecturocebus cupreus]